MMPSARAVAGPIMVLLVWLLLSCSDDSTYYITKNNTAFTVDGQVRIWLCGVGDIWNNPPGGDMRFHTQTNGDSALITFTRLNGLWTRVYTDDSSSFSRVLDEGPYWIVIETGWTVPDTIKDFNIASDTTLIIDLVFTYLDPVLINAQFYYETGDTATAQEEWDMIRLLNGYLWGKLAISGTEPPLELRDVHEYALGAISSSWKISIHRPPYHIHDVLEQAQDILWAMPSRFPNLRVYQYYAYICMW